MQAAPQGGIYNYFHSLLPPLSLAPFLPRTPLYSISLFFKGLLFRRHFRIFSHVGVRPPQKQH
ncbi:DNA methylase [Porphyromonas gingivalis]|nr:DNA methylase [Porphyromonas gingivalis]ATR97440.1 DNA methylase [Porphyromonas gingivalis]